MKSMRKSPKQEKSERKQLNITPMPDEDDRKFYDVAKSSGAFLITGNIKHFPSESFIVTPADFLRIKWGQRPDFGD